LQILEDGSLLIAAVRANDAGKYTCIRTNDAGMVEESAFLSVLGIIVLYLSSSFLHVNSSACYSVVDGASEFGILRFQSFLFG